MFAYNSVPAYPYLHQGKYTNKRKIQAHFIRRNMQILQILLKNIPEIYEVYAKRIKVREEEQDKLEKVHQASLSARKEQNKKLVPQKRALLLEFYCKSHIPIVRIRQLEISLRRFLKDVFGEAIYFLFIRLSPKGEYKCISQASKIQNLYKNPRPLGLCIFQDQARELLQKPLLLKKSL